MKVLTLFAFLFASTNLIAQTCLGDFIFRAQVELDSFIIANPTCTTIDGSVTISSNDSLGDWITDLSGLQNIHVITGDLTFAVFSFVPFYEDTISFQGIHNLETVGGTFYLGGSSEIRLINVDGLENLTSVGELDIMY
jgi:hypothetical protein